MYSLQPPLNRQPHCISENVLNSPRLLVTEKIMRAIKEGGFLFPQAKEIDLTHPSLQLNTAIFSKILESCSPQLTHVKLNCSYHLKNWFEVIQNYAHLTSLSLKNWTRPISQEVQCLLDPSLFPNFENLELELLDLCPIGKLKEPLQLLPKCPPLTSLSIGCTLRDLQTFLNNNLQLEHLEFRGALATDQDFEYIAQLSQLESLKILFGYHLSDQTLQKIVNSCSHLKHLSFHQCRLLTQEGFKIISQLPALESVTFDNCKNLTDLELQMTVDNCPELKHLTIKNSKGITSIECISKLSKLESLTLGACPDLSDRELQMIVDGCPHLKHLVLDLHPLSSHSSPKAFPQLESLKLTFPFPELTTILANGQNLKHLEIRIATLSLQEAVAIGNCHQLQRLAIRFIYDATNRGLTDEVVQAMLQNKPELTELDISGTFHPDLSEEALLAAFESCPALEKRTFLAWPDPKKTPFNLSFS